MSKYKAKAVSRKLIKDYVKYIRHITGFENELYFPIIPFLDIILPELFDNFSCDIRLVEDMPNKCGETFPAENRIEIREDIYEKACLGDGFARLTVAHEIGHFLMHDMDSVSLCKLIPGEKLKAYEDPEWQADAFGGELLAPSYLIKNMSESSISKKCGITPRAAQVQKSKI